MSLRLFASTHLAALVLTGLAVGVTPATAGGLQLIAPQPVQYYSGSCGGCGGHYVQQPQYHAAPCGGCGYIAPQPQPTYHSTSCGGCGSSQAVPRPDLLPEYDDYISRQHYRRHVGYRHHRHHSHHWRHANTY